MQDDALMHREGLKGYGLIQKFFCLLEVLSRYRDPQLPYFKFNFKWMNITHIWWI